MRCRCREPQGTSVVARRKTLATPELGVSNILFAPPYQTMPHRLQKGGTSCRPQVRLHRGNAEQPKKVKPVALLLRLTMDLPHKSQAMSTGQVFWHTGNRRQPQNCAPSCFLSRMHIAAPHSQGGPRATSQAC